MTKIIKDAKGKTHCGACGEYWSGDHDCTVGIVSSDQRNEVKNSTEAALQADVDADMFNGNRMEFTIPEENLDYLKTKIGALQRRAKKLGVPEPQLEVLGFSDNKDDLTGEVERSYQVKVTGESPKYDGWSFVATIDLDPEEKNGLNVVKAISDEEIDPSWRRMEEQCDHCGVGKRGRHKLVVVSHEEGDQKIVGTSCLRDFLGHQSPQSIASWAEAIANLDELAEAASERSGERGTKDRRFDPEHYLAYVAMNIRENGWVSRTSVREYGGSATADEAMQDMFSPVKDKYTGEKREPEDEDYELACEAWEWAQNQDPDEGGYIGNVAAVASKSSIRYEDSGIAASVIAAYRRDQEQQLNDKLRSERNAERAANSSFVGEVGKREEFVGTVTGVQPFENEWGVKHLVKFTDGDGNEMVWWSSSAVPGPGSKVRGRATVKKHEEYRGVKQTEVSRFSWEAVSEEDA